MFRSYLSKNKKEEKDEDTFPSKLYFNLENFPFPSQNFPDPNVSMNTTLNSKNETLPIRQYLSKDLLDTINSSILENEINENDILFSSLHNYNNNNQNINQEEEENVKLNDSKDKNNNIFNEENCDIIIPIRKKKKKIKKILKQGKEIGLVIFVKI